MKDGKVFVILKDGIINGYYCEGQFADLKKDIVDIKEAEVVDGVLRLPEGIKGIQSKAFEGINVRTLALPLSIVKLASFSLVGFKEVLLMDRNNVHNIKRGENWDYGIRGITPCTKVRKFIYQVLDII